MGHNILTSHATCGRSHTQSYTDVTQSSYGTRHGPRSSRDSQLQGHWKAHFCGIEGRPELRSHAQATSNKASQSDIVCSCAFNPFSYSVLVGWSWVCNRLCWIVAFPSRHLRTWSCFLPIPCAWWSHSSNPDPQSITWKTFCS